MRRRPCVVWRFCYSPVAKKRQRINRTAVRFRGESAVDGPPCDGGMSPEGVRRNHQAGITYQLVEGE